MSVYHWIQRTIFNIYQDWHMKSPLFDRNGFHIDGINVSLKAIHDGYSMYTEIRPPRAIKGCTSMKVIAGKGNEFVNLYMEINGKKYCIADVNYYDAVQIMRTFVKKSILPEKSRYVEVLGNDNEKIKKIFTELSELLLRNAEDAHQFVKRVNLKTIEDMESAWIKLYKELLRRGKVSKLSMKLEKEDFVWAIKKLTKDLDLEIREDLLDQNECIPEWSKICNSLWTEYILAGMDIGSDEYILLVLSKKNYIRAKALARKLLHRIAAAEEM